MATTTLDPAMATKPGSGKITVHRLKHGKHEGKDPDTGKTRRYHANVPGRNVVRDFIDLSARWPEKFERIIDGQNPASDIDPATLIQPGETLNDFALRITELAKTRGASLTSASVSTAIPVVQTSQQPVSNVPAPGSSAPVQVTAGQYATFEAMSLKELVAHCEAEEINLPLKAATKKEDVLKILKGMITS